MSAQTQTSGLPHDWLLDLLARQRAAYAANMLPSAAVRADRLDRLAALVSENEQAMIAAIQADFGHRSAHEVKLVEIFMTIAAIRHQRARLRRWMRKQRVPTPLHMLPGRGELLRQPLGVVGVIGAWNYPVQLCLIPAAAALAAGNRVMIKPSDLTPAFSALLARLVAERFHPSELAVVEGGVDVGRAFSSLQFDHLFFTGSTAVGRQVAMAAAANLVPVTLELGGKSPAIIDASADLRKAAERIAFGKIFNAGQTCVAPDYVLLPRALQADFVREFHAVAASMLPKLTGNPDCTSIISVRHYERLQHLLAQAVADGATAVPADPASEGMLPHERKIHPTILLNVKPHMAVMCEEIFGPLLPVIPVDSANEAMAFVNARPRPLALYWFGRDMAARDEVLRNTIAGGVTINDTLWHAGHENLPFGGVGASGQGAYHGEAGFLLFSKVKPVFHQARLNGVALFNPPYGRIFERVLSLLKKLA